MPAAAWFTIAVAALIIAITAVGLLRVIFHLRAIRASLVGVTGGVALVGELDGVPEALATTDATVHEVSVGAVRYAGSVAKLLG